MHILTPLLKENAHPFLLLFFSAGTGRASNGPSADKGGIVALQNRKCLWLMNMQQWIAQCKPLVTTCFRLLLDMTQPSYLHSDAVQPFAVNNKSA